MSYKALILALSLGCIATTADAKKKKTSGDPIFTGWYADPEGALLDGKYWAFLIYHRRPFEETDGNHRVTCIDRLIFNADGTIQPVKMIFEGVRKSKIKK